MVIRTGEGPFTEIMAQEGGRRDQAAMVCNHGLAFDSMTRRRTATGIIAICFAAALCAAPVVAEDLLIGYVDVQALLDTSPQAEVAREKIEKEFAAREREVEQLAAQVRQQEYQFLDRATQMSPQERRRGEGEVRRLERDLRRLRDAFLEDLNARRRQQFSEFRMQVTELIQQVAKAENYDLVFIGAVLYASESADITDLVRHRLEMQFKNPGS